MSRFSFFFSFGEGEELNIYAIEDAVGVLQASEIMTMYSISLCLVLGFVDGPERVPSSVCPHGRMGDRCDKLVSDLYGKG